MQVLEHAVRMMKAPANEGVRDQIEARDVPVSDFPDLEFDPPNEPDAEPMAAAAPLVRRRAKPLFAESDEDAPLVAGERAVAVDDAPQEDERQFGPIVSWFGAAAAVALIAGISVWTYKLGQRDAMDVPIIAALEGPARIAPENPGGTQVAHQGLSVNNVLEGGGVASVAQQVTVAPTDETVSDQDAPQAALAAIAAARKPEIRPGGEQSLLDENMATVMLLQELAPEVQADTAPVVETPVVVEAPDAAEDAAKQAVADAIALATPEPTAPETGEPEVVADAAPAAEAVPTALEEKAVELAALGPVPPLGQGSAYAPAMLILPKARPNDLGQDMAAIVDAAVATVLAGATTVPTPVAAAVATKEVAAVNTDDDLRNIPLPAGTRLIQLGAFDSEAVARRQWQQISGRHSDLLGGKDHYVQKIDSSGRTFYRLRVAGYANKQETLAACAALTARGLPCMPTINR